MGCDRDLGGIFRIGYDYAICSEIVFKLAEFHIDMEFRIQFQGYIVTLKLNLAGSAYSRRWLGESQQSCRMPLIQLVRVNPQCEQSGC